MKKHGKCASRGEKRTFQNGECAFRRLYPYVLSFSFSIDCSAYSFLFKMFFHELRDMNNTANTA